jgi:ParB/RepB/Spo0J family partition protein
MNIQQYNVADIVVTEDRFREADPKKVEEIAQSFLIYGQLQPIIVRINPDGKIELVAGLHRLRAKQANGDPTIAGVLRDEVDEIFLREIELEENIRRQEMHWKERESAIATLHKLKVQRDPTWGLTQTSAIAGNPGKEAVSEALRITNMMALFPEIAKAKNKNQALNWIRQKAKSIVRAKDVKDNKIDYEFIGKKILLGDSVELIKEIPDESFHAVITDPPFGIGYDSRKSGTSGSLSAYEDTPENYRRLLSMAPDIYRVIKPDGWLIWFFGISWYEDCKRAFRDAGFTVDEIPVVWDRSEGRAFTTEPERYFGRGYDVALHCIKGNPGVVEPGKPNIIRIAPVQTADREALVERPVELYAEFIKRLTIKGQTVADFFVGSGSCPSAAAALGRDFFGIELDPERRALALTKIRSYIPEQIARSFSGTDQTSQQVGEGAA